MTGAVTFGSFPALPSEPLAGISFKGLISGSNPNQRRRFSDKVMFI